MAQVLNNWRLVQRVVSWGMRRIDDPDQSPDVWFWALKGRREGEEQEVRTSQLINGPWLPEVGFVEGEEVETVSGSIYQLGTPAADQSPQYA